MAAIGQEALKETAFLSNLRVVDALAHVVRAFEDPSIPHSGEIDPLRDLKSVDLDLIVSDLEQVETRLERMQKDLKKKKTPELEKENALLLRAKAHLETERPLREMEMTKDEKKVVRGFMFLSEKPMLYVLNIGESPQLGDDLESCRREIQHLREAASRPNTGATAICGNVEAELTEMSDEEAAEFLSSYGLKESGLTRLIRTSYALLGLISFFTVEKTNAAPGRSRRTRAPSMPRAPSTPTWNIISSAPKPFAGTPCSNWVRRPPPAPPANCGWKAKTTSCRTEIFCTYGIRVSANDSNHSQRCGLA